MDMLQMEIQCFDMVKNESWGQFFDPVINKRK